jgi:hypothetical protein
MLEPRDQASAAATGQRTREKRGILARTGIVLPAAAIAAMVVAAVTIAAYLVSPNGSGATSLSQALGALPKSHSIALLEQEREQIIVMNEAASTMTQAVKPTVVSPSDIKAAGGDGGSSQSDSNSTGSSASTAAEGQGFEPTPAVAQEIAQEVMPSFGFSVSSQWSCLEDLWNQESSWEWDAQNASGAYGIPQSLPASKMDSVASDWQTDATTQIKWGLEYIQQVYGTPCAAWGHEESSGFY